MSRIPIELQDRILDIIEDWQKKGRPGYCMPIGASQSEIELTLLLEEIVNERRRDNCSICGGTGFVDDGGSGKFPCSHCSSI